MIATAPPTDAPATAEVHILFFGKLADRFGRARDIAVPAGGCMIGELRRRLAAQAEDGQVLNEPSVRAAVDQQLVLHDAAWVRPGQDVAFLPAFSGG